MNKFVAIALVAVLFTAANGQNTTSNSTTTSTSSAAAIQGNGTIGSWCRANTDCLQSTNLCCAASNTGFISYKQFNCQRHTNGTSLVGTCIANGTDYSANCVGEAKTCLNTKTKAAFCGGSLAMSGIDLWPNTNCTSTSSAYTMMVSFAFFAFTALSFVF
jgi:hypothetical protein